MDHVWNSVVNKKVFSKMCFVFFMFKLGIIYLDDNFQHPWHYGKQLHEVVAWSAFQLTDVP